MLKLLTLNVTLCHKTKYFTFQQSSKNTDSAVCDSIKHWSVKVSRVHCACIPNYTLYSCLKTALVMTTMCC